MASRRSRRRPYVMSSSWTRATTWSQASMLPDLWPAVLASARAVCQAGLVLV